MTHPTRQTGYNFVRGAIVALSETLIIAAILLGALVLARNALNIGVDDTDKDAWHRSGLSVHVDAKTGVQYLSDGHGGLTPRLK